MSKKETVIAIKTYVDGKLVDESAKVVEPDTDWISIILSTIAFLIGAWFIGMGA